MILRAFLFLAAFSLLAPQISFAQGLQCRDLFSLKHSVYVPPKSLKHSILSGALSKANKIKLTHDQDYIDSVLKKWDINETTPQKIEVIAQKLVTKKDMVDKGDRSPLARLRDFIKDILIKPDPVKELARIRGESLVLKRELLLSVDTYVRVKENSRYDNYKAFRHKHFNKIQLAKMVTISGLINGSFYAAFSYLMPAVQIPPQYFFFPTYVPMFNFIKNLDFTDKELNMIQLQGFEAAYPMIRERHKLAVNTAYAAYGIPKAIYFTMLGYLSYVAYNYLKFQEDVSHYNVTIEEVVPTTHALYIGWRENFILENGREPNMRNAQDREEWRQVELFAFRLWSDEVSEKSGRRPDLSKPKDLKAWQEHLSELESSSQRDL